MKRYTLLSLILCVTLGVVSVAEAKNGSKNRSFGFQQLMGGNSIGNLASKFNKHRDDNDDDDHQPPKPIDPGIGNGGTSNPMPTMPGYVWVDDHWEREKAPKSANPPQGRPGYIWVGDHWERVKAPTTVSTMPPMVINPGTVVVRDHRGTSAGSGGVTVSNTPEIRDHRKPKPSVVPGLGGGFPGLGGLNQAASGPIVRDHRTSTESHQGGTWTPNLPIVRDHRDSSAANGGVTVTSSPTIRDHRKSSQDSSTLKPSSLGGVLQMGAP